MRISDWSSDVCSSDLGAQVGEFLPSVAGHLGQHRALAVDDLVVAQRQDEVLGKGVVDAEGELVVVVPAVEIGRASCRERVWQSVEISVVAVTVKKERNVRVYIEVVMNVNKQRN